MDFDTGCTEVDKSHQLSDYGAVNGSKQTSCKLRLLVVIASYGEKNLGNLNRIIETYQDLPIDVDIIVLSEAPKNLRDGIEVVVGLPAKNPWSLPFGHKAIFERELPNYDLFIYSEDDILFTERNLNAFLSITPDLASDEIAGFLRYEEDANGTKWITSAHGQYHWIPESVRSRGDHLVAEFTNEHAALYILTREQLRQCIQSGGFLRAPHQGKYDMLCSAATDPYTSCGFRKVICISALKDFLVHHASNRYSTELDVSLLRFERQVEALGEIYRREQPARTLCSISPLAEHSRWTKSYYERPNPQLLALLPESAKTALSVGCGSGETEILLQRRGAKVTVLPLDSVIGVAAADQGLEVINGTWEEGIETVQKRSFEVIILTNLLHLQERPGEMIHRCASLLDRNGVLLLGGPNFDRFPWLVKRLLGVGEFGRLRSFDRSGVTLCGPRSLTSHLRNAGLEVSQIVWTNHNIGKGFLRNKSIWLGPLTARDWVLQARLTNPAH